MTPTTITEINAYDVRFPTSQTLAGSDAMNEAPDYSAAYAVLKTDHPAGFEGHGLTFTIGRGNEVCVAAINALKYRLTDRRLEDLTADMGAFWRHMTGDSQLRWIGPEKGAIHLACAALVNAVWDLWAKTEQKPLWKLLCDMEPHELVRCIDFRYISDALTAQQALEWLRARKSGRTEREEHVRREGFPAYATSVGWLANTDAELRRRCKEAVAAGFDHVKMKVGADVDSDLKRARIVRSEIGPQRGLMMDANQVWGIDEAIEWIKRLRVVQPFWIEEPTSPDDVLGHARIAREVAPIRVATGEHCQNRVVFKQLLQAEALAFCQIDACRLGGVNEVLAVLLLAARFGVPVCPHAGGVGLCEYVQHLSIFDYISISASLDDRMTEYVDELHEHFLDPVEVSGGRYRAPTAPGYSITLRPESIQQFEYPTGPAWAGGPQAPSAAAGGRS